MCELITIPELAATLGVPVQTVYQWRKTGYGPRSAKIGRRVLYRQAEVMSWLDAQFDHAS